MEYQMRFYKNELPAENDIVIGKVVSYENNIFKVELLEYQLIEAILPISEITKRRRIRSIKKYIRVGENYPLMVISLNEENKTVDLSYKYLDDDDKKLNLDKFNHYLPTLKIFYNFMMYILNINIECDSERKNMDKKKLLEYAEKTIWKLDRGNSTNILRLSKIDNSLLDNFDLNEEEINIFLNSVNKYVKDVQYKVAYQFFMSISNLEAVNIIKKVLENAYIMMDDEDTKIILLNAPLYEISLRTVNKIEAEKKLNEVVKTIKNNICEKNGNFSIQKCYISNNVDEKEDIINIVNL